MKWYMDAENKKPTRFNSESKAIKLQNLTAATTNLKAARPIYYTTYINAVMHQNDFL